MKTILQNRQLATFWRADLISNLALIMFTWSVTPIHAAGLIRWWVSSADLKQQFAEQPALEWSARPATKQTTIEINPAVIFQTLLGLGSSLEPSTCWNLWLMSVADRERTIKRLVSPTTGVGMNLMRICIDTPDFTGDAWYSYNDIPPGETDPELQRFSIEKDRAYFLPALKLAR